MLGRSDRAADLARELRRLWGLLADEMPTDSPPPGDSYEGYWDRREGWEDATPRRAARHREHRAAILRVIEDGTSVLDIGCGDGALLATLREQRPHCRLQGVDVSAAAVRLTRSRGIQAELMDTRDGALRGLQPFDYVVMSEVIEHVPDPERLLTEAGGIARRAVIITTPNVAYIIHRARLALFGRFPVTTAFHIREHLCLWSIPDFRHWAASLGFQVQEVTGIGGLGSFQLNKRIPNVFAVIALYVLIPPGPENTGSA